VPKGESPVDRERLAYFRAKLEEDRDRYEAQVRAINDSGLGMSMTEQYGEDATYDNHPADMGTEMFEREKDLGLRSNAQRFLKRIDHALARVEEGTYGTCEECGQPISEERLEAFASTTLCIECKKEQELLPDRFHRPIEEQVLSPPFGRTWRDGSGDPGVDGEDVWQEVAEYGTSETPQDVPGALKYTDLYHSGEHVYTVVEDVEGMVDEDGEPIGDTGQDRADPTDWEAEQGDPLYDEEMKGRL
jgi:YteA family regulatory protein